MQCDIACDKKDIASVKNPDADREWTDKFITVEVTSVNMTYELSPGPAPDSGRRAS